MHEYLIFFLKHSSKLHNRMEMEWHKQCYESTHMYLRIPKIVLDENLLDCPHYKFIHDSLSILMLLVVLATKPH